MATYILTSLFPQGLLPWQAELLGRAVTARKCFAFVASEFEKGHDITDYFFREMVDILAAGGLVFEQAVVVDGRMTPLEAQRTVAGADVVWLCGGDTLAQLGYIEKYGLAPVIRSHGGVVFGMSAGTVNLAKTSLLYDPEYGQTTPIFYSGLGCADVTCDPHFNPVNTPAPLLEASMQQPFYGLCDNGIIICREGGEPEFYGDVYRLEKGKVTRVSR